MQARSEVPQQVLESREWLSAFMDGEAGVEMPAGAALDSAEGRANWHLYHLIGDALRTPDLAQPVPRAFHARFMAALEQEAAIVAPAALGAARRPGWVSGVANGVAKFGWPSLAAAAAVASVTWIAQPYLGGQGAGAPATLAVSQPAVRAPVETADLALVDYLDAHRQAAGHGAIRRVAASMPASMAPFTEQAGLR